MIGKTVSHYKILDKLGEGGMGVVYKAKDTKLKRTVAIKFLPSELTHDQEANERFIHEAQAASALDHSSICTIYEIDETEDGQLFIVMTYYEGEILKAIIERDPLPENQVLDISIQIIQGLARAHDAGIIHRDIKSANIVVTDRSESKILDFGLAKLTGQEGITKKATIMGTVAYMSPEQVQGLSVDHRTDIWSLGVVIYEMLTGQLPFKSHFDQAVMYNIVKNVPEPIDTFRSGLSMEWNEIVDKSLAKEPTERYQHLYELLDDLKALQQRLETGKTKEPLEITRPTRKKRVYLYSALVILIVLLILVGISFFPGSKERMDSIAVLPMKNLSGDPEQKYFVFAMTDALITELGKINALQVRSWTSVMRYEESDKSVPEIGRELNVDAVVEGSVFWSGNKIRINTKLIEALSDRQMWTASYEHDLKDFLDVQKNVAQAIVREIQIQLTPKDDERLSKDLSVDPEVYELYMRGRYFRIPQTNESLKLAAKYFEQAIAKDSTFAPAYAGLAKAIWLHPGGDMSKVKWAIKKALELDDTLPEAYMGVGDILEGEHDRDGAEQAYKRAIELGPNKWETHYEYGMLLRRTKRFDKALIEMKRALELDPVSIIALCGIAGVYRSCGQYNSAIDYYQKILELEPDNRRAQHGLAATFRDMGMYEKALSVIHQYTITESRDAWNKFVDTGKIYAMLGKRDQALRAIDSLKAGNWTESRLVVVHTYRKIASIYALLGEKNQAIHWLERVFELDPKHLEYRMTSSNFDSLRSDPRFKALLKKMGLEE